jgi:dTDP-4-amino-4,6-dideoxygalactose transaminase
VLKQRWPIIDARDHAAVARVLERGVLSGAAAPEMKALEAEFAESIGAARCLATNSGTSALHIALGAAGIGRGDEVIVPALSFVATAQAVLHQGGTPVFADVNPTTFNLDVADAARRVTRRTRAIVPVHLHGLPADMDEVNVLAREHGLVVIEDAAQAHGARYRTRPVGTLGAMAAFSLNSTKNLPAGEGGLFVTGDEILYGRAARIRFDGLDMPAKYDPARPLDDEADSLATSVGWMYLPGELTSAIARAQLSRLGETTARAWRNGSHLTDRLRHLPGLQTPAVPADRTHVFHKYRLGLEPRRTEGRRAPGWSRDRLLEALRAEGVEAVLWQERALPHHPLFASAEAFPHATAALDRSVVIGSQSYPLFAQPLEIVDGWADTFEKVWRRLHF